ncbi:MAG TPA: hypothetical protein DHV48_08535 [Prolixibacteraceae bacterium]|nr:hypothetical protein [Prolixibacteraceae bacterium]
MRPFSDHSFIIFFLVATLLLQFNCTSTKIVRKHLNNNQVNSDTFLNLKNAIKVHMLDGGLYVINNPIISITKDSLIARGIYYNTNREKIRTSEKINTIRIDGQSAYKIPLSDVALVETNKITGLSGKLVAMSLVGVPSVISSVYCLTNPKACFGSCPTFYAWNGESMKLMAEGFSSSILPVFENSDVDMLYWAKNEGRKDFQIKLTNEALETHIIRYADLLVFPKHGNERIFATEDGKFYKTSKIISPTVCSGSEGDCRNLILQMDAQERYSEADSKNLAAREYVDLEFDGSAKNQLGLIIGSRQTLLTTYLFYQSLAFLGNNAGYFASRIESGDKALQRRVEKIWDLLGTIEVFVQGQSGKWIKTGEIDEMGPIASDVHLVTLPPQEPGTIKVRLKMTRGLWRIDYIGLTDITEPVEPIQINPTFITTNDSINDLALNQLCHSDEPLITLPGDSHTLNFILPDISNDYEIFIKSKGYYLEWMREEWIAEQNKTKATLMFGMPKLYLKLVANKFKAVEPTMEEVFWRSRYVKN